MKKNLLRMLVSLVVVAALSVGLCSASPVELNISAAVSLKDALTKIQNNYQAQNPNVKLVFNLGASGALQHQIEQGAPADIFISAAAKQMDTLAAENLVNVSTRKNLVENALVLIVPQGSTLGIASFKDIAKSGVQKFAIGEPNTVPAGQYAKQVFDALGIWDQVAGKAVQAQDVRAVLTYVETGNVDAGIVYKTDALNNAKVQVVAVAPAGSHKLIVYPVAILTGAKQPKEAANFLAYLSGPQAKAVFKKYGFVVNN